MSQEVKVSVKNLFKIFGPHPKKALGMLEQGLAKEEIFEKTETTIGVQNASFEIPAPFQRVQRLANAGDQRERF